jgi:SAM-dependent methyltransferase
VTRSSLVPARIAWAVELLDVGPDDRILEFGCGPGVAAALVADRLVGGRLTAIDRSATAIERARARTAHHLDAGRVVLEQVALARFSGERDGFDKALGINVNLFWTTSADAECAVLTRVLRPGGVLRLVYAGPQPAGAGGVGPVVEANLRRHGFTTGVDPSPDGAAVCITGRLAAPG